MFQNWQFLAIVQQNMVGEGLAIALKKNMQYNTVGEGLAIAPTKNMFQNWQFLANVQKFSGPLVVEYGGGRSDDSSYEEYVSELTVLGECTGIF